MVMFKIPVEQNGGDVVPALETILLCRACLHSFFIDRQSARELRITRILRDAVI